MWEVMDFAGSHLRWLSIRAGGRIAIAATGFIPIAGGIGCLIIPGAGLRSIMDDGFVMPVWVGVGRRTECGVHPGFVGGIQMIFAAGHRCRRRLASALVWASSMVVVRLGSVSILELRRAGTHSSH